MQQINRALARGKKENMHTCKAHIVFINFGNKKHDFKAGIHHRTSLLCLLESSFVDIQRRPIFSIRQEGVVCVLVETEKLSHSAVILGSETYLLCGWAGL
jgi:hypothetical protein